MESVKIGFEYIGAEGNLKARCTVEYFELDYPTVLALEKAVTGSLFALGDAALEAKEGK